MNPHSPKVSKNSLQQAKRPSAGPQDTASWVRGPSAGSESYFLTLRDVERLTSLKKSTIYALIQRGEFPKPVTITARRVAWVSSEIQTWIAARVGAAV